MQMTATMLLEMRILSKNNSNINDEDDSNSDIVEDRGGIVVFRVVDVQTGQH